MKITVKAAHYICRPCYRRSLISEELVKYSDSNGCNPTLMPVAFGPLYKNNDGFLVKENVFDAIYPRFNEEERNILRSSLIAGRFTKKYRSKVALDVEASLTVGALKSLLNRKSWIPKKNLVLIQQGRPLDDERATLHDYALNKEEMVLLACMGGSFPLTVFDTRYQQEFVIPIGSCFETLGELKKKIYQKAGYPIDEQLLHHQEIRCDLRKNNTPLGACGIVRPYLRSMPEEAKRITLFVKQDLLVDPMSSPYF